MAAVFATRTTAEWEALLREADIPHMPLRTLRGLVEDEHLAAIGFFTPADHPAEGSVVTMRVPSRWSESQPAPSGPAPRLGEHTEELLLEHGFSRSDIAALTGAGCVI